MKKLLICLLLLYANILAAQDASTIISKTEAVYSSLPVYLDSGKVVSAFYNNARPHSSAMLFKTAYKSTGAYNFEFHDMGKDHLHIVHRDDHGKVSVRNGSAINSGKPFVLALAGATGISSNAIGIVTDLLIPGIRKAHAKNIFYTLTEAKLEASESVGGRPCYKIKGKNDRADGYTIIWISKDDHLIRKVEFDRAVNDFRVRTTYTFIPYTLKTENKALFTFQPTKKIEL